MARSQTRNGRLSQWRIHVFSGIIVLAAGLVFYRLFTLTYVKHSDFVRSAQSQYNNPAAQITGRGDLYLSDLASGTKYLVGTNRSFWYVYSNNAVIESADTAADKLAGVLKMPKDAILKELTAKPSYQIVANHLTKEVGTQVNDLKIKGITAAQEIDRYYPKNTLLAPVLGFVGFDGSGKGGRYGVEAYYEDVLSGRERTQDISGNTTYSSVSRFFRSLLGKKDATSPISLSNTSSDIVLTIDHNIEAFAETKLDETLKKWHASGGSILVQDPKTGALLAMASSPSFDPNHYADFDLGNFLNKNVQQLFEPGSSFKSITMAAALDTGVVTPETTYTDTGVANFGTYTIKNFNEKANGVQTMRQVLEHSLNTGVMFAENKTGDDNFLNYVVGFGFGQKTDIDLPGEIGGNIANLYSGRKINFATASFGQGIAVTPIQIINAYSALANGGKLMRPYVVKEILKPDGSSIQTEPKIIDTPITEKTSRNIASMLTDVVNKGYDKARVPGYLLAGKTGTAQIPDGKGGYVGDKQFIHNFAGFAPANDPRFVIFIKMDRPQGITFAADSLSPVFGDMARYLLRYFNIPPTQ